MQGSYAFILHSIIIFLRPAWLARALLSFKRAQSSENDNRVKNGRPYRELRGRIMEERAMV